MANELVYNIAKVKFANGTLDWDVTGGIGDIRCLIIEGTVAAAATNPDSSTLTAALTGSTEASGTGYTRKSLGTKSSTMIVTQDDTNNRAILKADPITWTGANWGTADGIIVYLHVDGTDANDIPISFHDGGLPVTTNGGDLTINWAGGSNDEVIYLT